MKFYDMQFKNNIINIHKDNGRIWLNNLEQIVRETAANWSLNDLKPLKNLTYNYVLSGFQNNKPIILKLNLDFQSLKREARALQAFENCGSVKLLAQKEGALLLEHAMPGISLKSFFPQKEFESIAIASELLNKLHTAKIPNQGFAHINDGLIILDGDWTIPSEILQQARFIRDKLKQTSLPSVLLHGDFHHDNILKDGDSWIAIDPKGVIGEPAYDAAGFIMNPIPNLLHAKNVVSIMKNRIDKFGNTFDVETERILNWCFVRAVQCWIWNLEDNLNTNYFEKLTKILHKF